MNSFDSSVTDQIITLLKGWLDRQLTNIGIETFKLLRSGMAYELIIGTLESPSSIEQLENYLRNVKDEYKKHNKCYE